MFSGRAAYRIYAYSKGTSNLIGVESRTSLRFFRKKSDGGDDPQCVPKKASAEKRCDKKKPAKTVGKLPLDKIPKEADTEPPVYDPTCQRPYTNPCRNEKPCRSDTDPRPVVGYCKGRPRQFDCGEPDCPHEKKFKGKFLKQLALGIGVGALGYLLYHNYKPKELHYTHVEKTCITSDMRKTEPEKEPKSSAEIPGEVDYLLVGGGTASFAAFRAIKSNDPEAKILVVTREMHNPYMRPPLSKELFWTTDRNKAYNELEFKQWNGTSRNVYYEPEEFYTPIGKLEGSKTGGVSVVKGYTVKRLDVERKVAYLEGGKSIKYGKCLLATGGSPKKLPAIENAPDELKRKMTIYRDITDFRDLECRIARGLQSVAIVGAGFQSSELAFALARRGAKQKLRVYQVFKENGILSHVLPSYLAEYTAKKIQEESIQLVNNSEIEDVALEGNKVKLFLSGDKCVSVEHVVVCVGLEPNTDLAEESKLEVDPVLGGFVVNAELQARTALFAAGDCASFYDLQYGRRRIEHHDHAVVSGRLAGENMTGAAKPFKRQPMFWSEVGPEIGFEAIGVVDSRMPTLGVFPRDEDDDDQTLVDKKTPALTGGDKCKDPLDDDTEDEEKKEIEYKRGIVFYLDNEIVVGMILWNLYNKIPLARQILLEKKKYEDLNEVAKLFDIFQQTSSPSQVEH